MLGRHSPMPSRSFQRVCKLRLQDGDQSVVKTSCSYLWNRPVYCFTQVDTDQTPVGIKIECDVLGETFGVRHDARLILVRGMAQVDVVDAFAAVHEHGVADV